MGEHDIALLVLNEAVTTIDYVNLLRNEASAEPAQILTEELTKELVVVPTEPTPNTKTPTTTKKHAARKLNTTKRLATNAIIYSSRKAAIVAGFGTTSSAESLPTKLRKANVTVLESAVCAAQYGTLFDSATMLCAIGSGINNCQGDSGGPIYVDGVQVGITSYGYGCTILGFANVYTRVSGYIDWISNAQADNPGQIFYRLSLIYP
ncbi:trypsin alpha-3-like [Daphnia carinata]|uniref:trypsin alpha-3-like n=1 Tax=Daphnia carinata TaxID=120202 RepID=UPI0028685315|nr:trypsin alpha-3-like [Daphnia carinata]